MPDAVFDEIDGVLAIVCGATKADKLLQKARTSPANIRFDELLKLAKHHGWSEERKEGSHRIYVHPTHGTLAFQSGPDGKAMRYQVKLLLETID